MPGTLRVSMVLFLLVQFVSSTISTYAATRACGRVVAVPTVCRNFGPIRGNDPGEVDVFQFSSTVFNSGAEASSLLREIAANRSYRAVPTSFDFGDETVSMTAINKSNPKLVFAILGFRIGNVVATWRVEGESFDPFVILGDIHEKVDARINEDVQSKRDQATQLLPQVSELPEGFELTDEDSVGFSETGNTAGLAPTAMAVRPTEVTRPTEPPKSSAPLQILDMTTENAGLGDGTFYAYVEVRNNTGELIPYIGLDGTCRDSLAGVVGTGFGAETNVFPGETIVVTVIFFSVPDCTIVQVRFDGLTFLF